MANISADDYDKCPKCGAVSSTILGTHDDPEGEMDVYACAACKIEWPTEWNKERING